MTGAASPPHPDAPSIYLLPGQIVVTEVPSRITTILGSCVSVCLRDARTGIAGVNHFLLPAPPGGPVELPLRFGTTAVPALVNRLLALGAHTDTLQAKIFGGACVLAELPADRDHLGRQNVQVAYEILAGVSIFVASADTEGRRGRKLVFDSGDGSAWVRLL